jgi:hypothetical protein
VQVQTYVNGDGAEESVTNFRFGAGQPVLGRIASFPPSRRQARELGGDGGGRAEARWPAGAQR